MGLGGRVVERLPCPASCPGEHRRPENQQRIPDHRADQRGLDDLLRPSSSAKKAIISSGALPKVTFSSPATPGPDRAESCSVASLISAAAGTTANAEENKTSGGDAWASFNPTASGMNTLSEYTGRTRQQPRGDSAATRTPRSPDPSPPAEQDQAHRPAHNAGLRNLTARQPSSLARFSVERASSPLPRTTLIGAESKARARPCDPHRADSPGRRVGMRRVGTRC